MTDSPMANEGLGLAHGEQQRRRHRVHPAAVAALGRARAERGEQREQRRRQAVAVGCSSTPQSLVGCLKAVWWR